METVSFLGYWPVFLSEPLGLCPRRVELRPGGGQASCVHLCGGSCGSKTGKESPCSPCVPRPVSGSLGSSQFIALFEYLRFLEGSTFCLSGTTGTILGVEDHRCVTLQLLEVRNGGHSGTGGRKNAAVICVLVSFWKTSPKIMSLRGEVAAKMTECQHVYDSS